MRKQKFAGIVLGGLAGLAGAGCQMDSGKVEQDLQRVEYRELSDKLDKTLERLGRIEEDMKVYRDFMNGLSREKVGNNRLELIEKNVGGLRREDELNLGIIGRRYDDLKTYVNDVIGSAVRDYRARMETYEKTIGDLNGRIDKLEKEKTN